MSKFFKTLVSLLRVILYCFVFALFCVGIIGLIYIGCDTLINLYNMTTMQYWIMIAIVTIIVFIVAYTIGSKSLTKEK